MEDLEKSKSAVFSSYYGVLEDSSFVGKIKTGISNFGKDCKYKWMPKFKEKVSFANFTAIQLLDRVFSKEEKLSLSDRLDNILYFSYREGIFPIKEGREVLNSDAGWGCTLRTGQMLLANSLLLLQAENIVGDRRMACIKEVIVFFLDYPVDKLEFENLFGEYKFYGECVIPPFSVHSIMESVAQKGKTRGVKLTNSEVVGSFVEQSEKAEYFSTKLLYFPDGVVDLKEVVLNIGEEYDKGNIVLDNKKYRVSKKCVVFIGFSAGANRVEKSKIEALMEIFSLPGFSGIMGGRGDQALYFCGIDEDGELIYLDPHETRPSLTNSNSVFLQDYSSYRIKDFFKVKPEKISGFMTVGVTIKSGRDVKELDKIQNKLIKFTFEKEKQEGLADFVENEEDDF